MVNRGCTFEMPDGLACRAPALRGKTVCYWHDPDKAEGRWPQSISSTTAPRSSPQLTRAKRPYGTFLGNASGSARAFPRRAQGN
jgi:hypothetical protein